MPYNRIITSYEFPATFPDNEVNQTEKLYHLNEKLIKDSEYTRTIKCLHGDIFSYNCIVSSSEDLEKYLIEQKKKFKETRNYELKDDAKKIIVKSISKESLNKFLLVEKQIYNSSQYNLHAETFTDGYFYSSMLDFISENYLTIVDYYISIKDYKSANEYLNRYFIVFNKNNSYVSYEYRKNLKNYISRMSQIIDISNYSFITPDSYIEVLEWAKYRMIQWEKALMYRWKTKDIPTILFLLNPDEIENQAEYYLNQIQYNSYNSSFKKPSFYNPLNSIIHDFSDTFTAVRSTIDLMDKLEEQFNHL